MSCAILLSQSPRSIILVSGGVSQVVIKITSASAKHTISFCNSRQLNMSGLIALQQKPVLGCLGIVAVDAEMYVGLIIESNLVGDLEGNNIFCITKVAFIQIASSKYDWFENRGDENVHPCEPLIKLLSCGSFYYSTMDLTRPLLHRVSASQDISCASSLEIFDLSDQQFVWNKSIMSDILRQISDLPSAERVEIQTSMIFKPLVQGFVGLRNIITRRNDKIKFAIISRLSASRAGTRFNARGIDDDGNVSNFVHTEFLIYNGTNNISFLQIRGSIPVFWEQTGLQVVHKVKISRGPESTQIATAKHFRKLIDAFQNVQIVNLLSQVPGNPEAEIFACYKSAVFQQGCILKNVVYGDFDFKAIVKRDEYDKLDGLLSKFRAVSDQFGYTHYDSQLNTVVETQRGVFRTNCLDCLDRTNVVQATFGIDFVKRWMDHLKIYREEWEAPVNSLWADNGDWLSIIYAGTGALKSSFTRSGKPTVFGFLDDAAKSVNRFYVANFQDKNRQEGIDMLVGRAWEDIPKKTGSKNDNSTERKTIFVGTFNLNGKLPPSTANLDAWVKSKLAQSYSLIVIGVQELIELTPNAFISADSDKFRLIWESAIHKCLNKGAVPTYGLLRSVNLIALGLFAFAHVQDLPLITNLQTSSVKTGLMGMAANKGGVGLSLSFGGTSLVFVTAHFAAGYNEVDDRNRDYLTITNELTFKGRPIANHDLIFWFGDFNYRITGLNSEIRNLVKARDLMSLIPLDQLKEQMDIQRVFSSFLEAPITFDPTYKYDNNSTSYDTSEKARIPAWTDRILYRGDGIDVLEYQRAEVLISDHRPVRAIFEIQIVPKSNIETQSRIVANAAPLIDWDTEIIIPENQSYSTVSTFNSAKQNTVNLIDGDILDMGNGKFTTLDIGTRPAEPSGSLKPDSILVGKAKWWEGPEVQNDYMWNSNSTNPFDVVLPPTKRKPTANF